MEACWQCTSVFQVAPQKCERHAVLPHRSTELPAVSGTLLAIGRYVIMYVALFYIFVRLIDMYVFCRTLKIILACLLSDALPTTKFIQWQ
jgi:hypothetical protein